MFTNTILPYCIFYLIKEYDWLTKKISLQNQCEAKSTFLGNNCILDLQLCSFNDFRYYPEDNLWLGFSNFHSSPHFVFHRPKLYYCNLIDPIIQNLQFVLSEVYNHDKTSNQNSSFFQYVKHFFMILDSISVRTDLLRFHSI